MDTYRLKGCGRMRVYKCKCQICGKSLTTDIAYRVVDKSQPKYYCSSDEYNAWHDKKIQDDLEEDILHENITYCIGETINTAIYKEITEWKTVADTKKLNSYFFYNRDSIVQSIDRMDFINEYAKIRYFSAIVKNTINDFVEPQPEIKHEVTYDDIPEKSVYKPKKRTSLSDFL